MFRFNLLLQIQQQLLFSQLSKPIVMLKLPSKNYHVACTSRQETLIVLSVLLASGLKFHINTLQTPEKIVTSYPTFPTVVAELDRSEISLGKGRPPSLPEDVAMAGLRLSFTEFCSLLGVPVGYRLLSPEEITKEGDRYFHPQAYNPLSTPVVIKRGKTAEEASKYAGVPCVARSIEVATPAAVVGDYYQLKVGDVIKAGDEVFYAGVWQRDAACAVGQKQHAAWFPRRRKVVQQAPATPAAETSSALDVGAGYRRLAVGEVVQAGDEYLSVVNGGWLPRLYTIGDKQTSIMRPTRRKTAIVPSFKPMEFLKPAPVAVPAPVFVKPTQRDLDKDTAKRLANEYRCSSTATLEDTILKAIHGERQACVKPFDTYSRNEKEAGVVASTSFLKDAANGYDPEGRNKAALRVLDARLHVHS